MHVMDQKAEWNPVMFEGTTDWAKVLDSGSRLICESGTRWKVDGMPRWKVESSFGPGWRLELGFGPGWNKIADPGIGWEKLADLGPRWYFEVGDRGRHEPEPIEIGEPLHGPGEGNNPLL